MKVLEAFYELTKVRLVMMLVIESKQLNGGILLVHYETGTKFYNSTRQLFFIVHNTCQIRNWVVLDTASYPISYKVLNN